MMMGIGGDVLLIKPLNAISLLALLFY